MREIKFRVYDIGRERWVRSSFIMHTKTPLREEGYVFQQYQNCTDVHGMEIYEGDIVDWKKLGEGVEEGLELVDDEFHAMYRGTGLCEILGNKYDNPKLFRSVPI